MHRNVIAWALALPLSLAGMLAAHEFAWNATSHEHTEADPHAYLQYGALFAALGVAAVLVAAVAQLMRGVAGEDVAAAPSARAFAAVPIVGFLIQEHLEHLASSRELEIAFFVSPTFLVGLALQLPFALAALFVARLILGLVATLARAIGSPPPALRVAPATVIRPAGIHLPARPVLARQGAGRAPPLSL